MQSPLSSLQSLDGGDAEASDAEEDAAEEEGSEEDAEDNPELQPLKEALRRAELRRGEATGIREALEAEAQEVAQLAVNAQDAFATVSAQIEEVTEELQLAEAARVKLEAGIAKLRVRIAGAALSEDEDGAGAGASEGGGAAALGAQPSGALESMEGASTAEDLLWDKGQQLEGVAASIVGLQEKVCRCPAARPAGWLQQGMGRLLRVEG